MRLVVRFWESRGLCLPGLINGKNSRDKRIRTRTQQEVGLGMSICLFKHMDYKGSVWEVLLEKMGCHWKRNRESAEPRGGATEISTPDSGVLL